MAEAGLVWFITGTTSGFGKRIVDVALSRGDRVVATARSLARLQETFSPSPALHLLELDVASGTDAVNARVTEGANVWGRIDVLVNNAGIGLGSLVEEGGTETLRQQFETNLFGVLDVTTAALPYMRKQRSGTVVMMGSRAAWIPERPGIGFYAASKAALHCLGETLSLELAPFSIRVLIVEPGAFRTEGIYGQKYNTSNPIPDYNDLRTFSKAGFASIGGTQKGDPDKAAVAIVDVVRGEGVAEGKPWPLYLVLGEDAEQNVRDKIKKVGDVLEEWKQVSRNMNID